MFSLLPTFFFPSQEFSSYFIRFHSLHLFLDSIHFSVLILTFSSFFLYSISFSFVIIYPFFLNRLFLNLFLHNFPISDIFDHLSYFSIFFLIFFYSFFHFLFPNFSIVLLFFPPSLNHNIGSCYYCTRYYSLYPLSIPSTFPSTHPLPYSVFLHWRLSFTPLLFLLYPLLEPILTPTFINSDLIRFASNSSYLTMPHFTIVSFIPI